MIVAIVTFRLPKPVNLDEITKTFQSTAPRYKGVAGLLRKNYFVSEDGPAPVASTCGKRARTRSAPIRRRGRSSSRASTRRRPRSSICTRP